MADDEIKPSTARKRSPRKRPEATTSEATAASTADAGQPGGAGTGSGVMSTESAPLPAVRDVPADADSAVRSEPATDDKGRTALGELTLHSRFRDITILLDGGSAEAMMAVFSGTGTRADLQDLIIPGLSNMRNVWAAVDLTQLVGMTWLPGLPRRSDGVMTIDPPMPNSMSS